ncbi:hypothetical protein LSAT2_023953 [Lamellibrachia satsuma]|nr:hypothetical protein LSAT2_023953 [Lamellibrachia satsuma]
MTLYGPTWVIVYAIQMTRVSTECSNGLTGQLIRYRCDRIQQLRLYNDADNICHRLLLGGCPGTSGQCC